MESVPTTVLQYLGLVDKQLLGVIDDETKPRRVLLTRDNLLVFVTLVVEILLGGFLIRVVSRPDDARLVVNALRAEGKLKGGHEVVPDERMLCQLQAIVVVVGVHPHNDLSVGVKDDGVVVLTHFCL